jgi:hypothetical protein
MFVTKSQLEERRKLFPRVKSYPATMYVRFENAEHETQCDPETIEIDIEQRGGTVGFFIQASDSDAKTLARELQELDQATNDLPKEE